MRLLQEGGGSLRGAIGTPAQVSELVHRYEAAGVDQVIFVLQSGRNWHEHICESLELFGAEVLPRFLDGREEREAAKADRLAPAIEAALARREPARTLPAPYRIDEDAEAAAFRRRRIGGIRELAGQARETVRGQLRSRLAALVGGASDEALERYLGRSVAQRGLFTAMARSYDPDHGSFTGAITFELCPAHGEPQHWTIEVRDGRARARTGTAPDPAVLLRMSVADFGRLVAGAVRPLALFLDNRATMEGDLRLVHRLPEMFGGRSPY